MSFKSGFIAVIGLPNVGKSSLVNALVAENVSIVTSKPQTTRKRTLGVHTKPEKYQMVFVDTPGLIDSTAGLNPFLKEEVERAINRDVDIVVVAIAPWEFLETEKPWGLRISEKVTKPKIYVATQMDLKKFEFEKVIERWKEWGEPGPLIPTSSVMRLGMEALEEAILNVLPLGPQFYDPEIYTPQSMRELASEIIRKSCFEFLHQEIPYGLAVKVTGFEESDPYKVFADIIVTKDGHKGMVIGQGGEKLKMIGTRARLELEKMFDHKVYLKLQVVVKPHWIRDRNWLEELGYVTT